MTLLGQQKPDDVPEAAGANFIRAAVPLLGWMNMNEEPTYPILILNFIDAFST